MEMLLRIRGRLIAMRGPRRGELGEKYVRPYYDELDRLDAMGQDTSDFRFSDHDWFRSSIVSDWGPITTVYAGTPPDSAPLVVSKHTFQARCYEAIRFVVRLIQQEERILASAQKSPSDILDERSRVLATIIDAYLQDQSEILVWQAGDDELLFSHPAWPTGYSPEFSYVKALARDGKIDFTPESQKGTWTINVPSATLLTFQVEDPSAVAANEGPERVDALMAGTVINNTFYGGSHNVASASRDFSQSIATGINQGDHAAFEARLLALGLAAEDIEGLSTALAVDKREAGRLTFGEKAQNWIGAFSVRASEGVVVGVLVEAVKQYVGLNSDAV